MPYIYIYIYNSAILDSEKVWFGIGFQVQREVGLCFCIYRSIMSEGEGEGERERVAVSGGGRREGVVPSFR